MQPPLENPVGGRGNAPSSPGANLWDDNDFLGPPLLPRQTPGAENGRAIRSPYPGQQVNTPRPGAEGKLPAQAQGPLPRTGKQPAISGRGRSSLKLPAAQRSPAMPGRLAGRNNGSGKISARGPTGAAPSQPGARIGAPARPVVNPRNAGLSPFPAAPPARQRQRKQRRFWLLTGLPGVLLLLLGWIIVQAHGGLASFGPLTATVTITPRSQTVQNNYLIDGVTTTPDPAQRQVAARVLTAQSNTQQATGKATGSIPATQAKGPLFFLNSTGSGLTIAGNGQTVLTGANGVQVTFNEPVFVPATGNASASINDAYAIQSGSRGNIPAFDITGPCCINGISVKNTTAFHGGQDPQPNSVIQQSDIDGAAQPLITQFTASTKVALQRQVKSNERVVDDSQQCPQTIHKDHNAGEHAPSVTLSVSVSCTEEVFDLAAAQHIASSLLLTNLPNGTNLTDYQLTGMIITSLVSDNVVSPQGQVSIQMQAAGKWIYQLSSQKLQQIRQSLAGRSKADAQNILDQYAGLASASISISSGSTMPADSNAITMHVVLVPGLSPRAPTSTGTETPVVPSPTSGVFPCPSPTSALGDGPPCG